jgi:hypothetical protein
MAGPSLAAVPLDWWSVLFAREPEPDLEFDDLTADLEEPPSTSSGSPEKRPRKSSSRRPIHWILFLLIAGIGALFAYDPELAMDVFGLAKHPAPPPPMTARPAPQPQPMPPASVPSVAPSMSGSDPAMPATGGPSANPSRPSASTTPMPQVPSATSSAGAGPLFSEGQRVVLISDPALPTEKVVLSPDPGGARPGPAVTAGTTLTVLDGEFRDTGWVYSVRSPEGMTGWLPEKRLKPQN